MLPDQAAPALHDVASLDDQVRVDEPPALTVVGLAVSETVGNGNTESVIVTVTELGLPSVTPPVGVSIKNVNVRSP